MPPITTPVRPSAHPEGITAAAGAALGRRTADPKPRCESRTVLNTGTWRKGFGGARKPLRMPSCRRHGHLIACKLADPRGEGESTSTVHADPQAVEPAPEKALDPNLATFEEDLKEVVKDRKKEKRMDGLMNRVDPEVAKTSQTRNPKRARRRCPQQTSVVRIALTGGPCAGKSSVAAAITEGGKKAGFDVYCGAESATLLMNSGLQWPEAPERQYVFQKALIKLGLQMERSLVSVAASTGRPSIVIFDRGLLDAAGYMDHQDWLKVLDRLDDDRGVTEDYVLKRYDGVIHLVTAADGAAEFYKQGQTTDDDGKPVFRRESLEQAIAVDKQMKDCWKKHPRQIIIDNEGSFLDKQARATKAVLEIAYETHPEEYSIAEDRRSH